MMVDEPVFWKTIIDHAYAGLAGLGAVVWGLLNKRIDGVERHGEERVERLAEEHGKRMDALTTETNRNREIAAKIFDKLDAMSNDSAARHERLLIAMHTGLAGKVDK